MKHYLMGLIFCLLTISIFSKEEKNPIISVDDIDITSTSTENIYVPDKLSSQGEYIIFEIPPKDSLIEIAYPVEEAIFMDALEDLSMLHLHIL